MWNHRPRRTISQSAAQASRLSSMQAAEKDIDERLAALRQQYRQKRQRSITEELFDIVAGFEELPH
ncbi:F0F1 ATP synthase subunit gamma [bacterium]|nr:F0F1 ATP synthase subunit gamma [bacterium]